MSFFNAYFDTSCQFLLFSGLHLFYWKYIGTLKARNIQNPKLGRKYTPSFIVFLSCSREINSWATGEFNANFQEKRKKETMFPWISSPRKVFDEWWAASMEFSNKANYYLSSLTDPIWWIICSMKIETASNTKQTTATAQVGVSVKLRSLSSSAMDQSPFSAGAQLSKYLQKNSELQH